MKTFPSRSCPSSWSQSGSACSRSFWWCLAWPTTSRTGSASSSRWPTLTLATRARWTTRTWSTKRSSSGCSTVCGTICGCRGSGWARVVPATTAATGTCHRRPSARARCVTGR
uniref:(northern house mosquito) hypothetical protein n=1 Tax=Culex pipiens TaxID=7175 RepID=A0A8D8F6X0_CULPI